LQFGDRAPRGARRGAFSNDLISRCLSVLARMSLAIAAPGARGVRPVVNRMAVTERSRAAGSRLNFSIPMHEDPSRAAAEPGCRLGVHFDRGDRVARSQLMKFRHLTHEEIRAIEREARRMRAQAVGAMLAAAARAARTLPARVAALARRLRAADAPAQRGA
jgi:hypothetical protein